MERLTQKLPNGVVKRTNIKGHSIMNRLAAYKDTNYAPEEIADMAARCNILDGHNKQLREIRDEYWEQITALKAENGRLRAERDAVLESLKKHGGCRECLYGPNPDHRAYPCHGCNYQETEWQWRGREDTTCDT